MGQDHSAGNFKNLDLHLRFLATLPKTSTYQSLEAACASPVVATVHSIFQFASTPL